MHVMPQINSEDVSDIFRPNLFMMTCKTKVISWYDETRYFLPKQLYYQEFQLGIQGWS